MGADHAYVRINGRVYPERNNRPIAYLFQDTFLPPHLKVKTILRLMKVKHLSAHPNVQPILNTKIANISGGEQRYLEILFILHRPLPYIILDEPFNGLSPILKEEVKELILSVAREGKGILLTDHDYRNVLDISTKNYVLKEGILRPFEDPEELRQYGYLP